MYKVTHTKYILYSFCIINVINEEIWIINTE